MKVPSPSVRELFLQASALENSEARVALLDEACGEDQAIRGEVEALLAEQSQLGDFLEDAAISCGTTALSSEVRASEQIGPYKLLQEIGEGGCGIVYMAEQETPVRRRVALKVIKLGMDTKSVIARFESERQALAMMDHPNIAKVLDAGTTERGRPYFVMELVRGIRITEYCDQHKLTTEERLRLFIQVSLAIQHAHQKGIIHRDIKPSNILVTLHDGVPVPKIIDFGIAKATEQRLTDKTLFTEFQSFIGTPAYMSPEQAEMSGLDIDTRSDIYALGVLLHELLVGNTPFDAAALRDAGLDACRQTIREVEPDRPSLRAATMEGPSLTTTAERRQLEPGKLAQQLRGDLDWIVMKCLEKDRQRRYATANALAVDVQRYLEGDLVYARPPSTLYRLQKLVRRHRTAVLAAGAVAATLVAAATISSGLAIRAMKAEETASGASRTERAQGRGRKGSEQAESSAARARLNEYVAEMNLSFQALRDGNLGRAFQLLEKHKLSPNGDDSRGFVWRYLRALCEGNEHVSFPSHLQSIRELAHAPEGDLMAVGTQDGVHLWDVRTRTRVIHLPTDAHDLAFAPDGQTLYTLGDDGIQAWNTSSWRARPGPLDRARHLSLSPDGTRLLVGGRSQVRLYDTATWEPLWEKREASSPLAFSHNGALVVTDSREGLQVREAATGKAMVTLEDSDLLFAWDVLFSPDNTQIIAPRNVTSAKGIFVLGLWDAVSGREIGTLPSAETPTAASHTGSIIKLQLATNGTLATASQDHSVGLWDLSRREPIALLRGHRHEVLALSFTPDGKSLATGSKDGALLLWPNEPPLNKDVIRGRGRSLGFSPDGRQLASVDQRQNTLYLIDLRSQKIVRSLPLAPRSGNERLKLDLSNDFSTLAQASGDSIHVWDLASGDSRSFPNPTPEHRIDRLTLSPNGDQLVTRSRELSTWLRITEAEPGQLAALPRTDSMKFSVDGSTLVGIHRLGQVHVWETETQTLRSKFTAPGVGRGVAVSPDGHLLANSGSPFGSDNSIHLRSTLDGEVIQILDGHKQSVASLAFSQDGRSLASSSYDSSVKFWHLATGRELVSVRDVGRTLDRLQFSPDGQWLVGNTGRFGQIEAMHLFHAPWPQR